MTLYELESKIFSLEGIRVIIRSNRDNLKIIYMLESAQIIHQLKIL